MPRSVRVGLGKLLAIFVGSNPEQHTKKLCDSAVVFSKHAPGAGFKIRVRCISKGCKGKHMRDG